MPPTYLDSVPLTPPVDLLRTLKPGAMIVLDNFEASLSDTDDGLSWLESLISQAPKGVTIIVISQRTLSTRWIDETLEVGSLRSSDVCEIFAAMCPIQWGHETADDNAIVEACGGHPLTVRLVASLVRYYASTRIVARRMQERAMNISEPGRSQHDKHTSLAIAMSLMWGELDERTRRLVLLSTLLEGNISLRLSLLYLSLTVAEFEDDVASCREWSMLGSAGLSSGDRWVVLPPVCSFVRSTTEFHLFQTSERVDVLRWIADILVGISLHYDDSIAIFERFDQEVGVIDAAIALLDDRALQAHVSIAITTGQYFFARDRGRERLDFLSRGAYIAESLSEVSTVMTILETMASICWRYELGTDLEEVLKRVERLVQTAEPRTVSAGAIARLSEMAVGLGLRPLDAPVDLISPSDGESPESLALTYVMQGSSLRRQGEFEHALELFERARELLSGDQRDAFNLACINFGSGCCRADLRLWEAAWQDLVVAVCGFVQLRSREYAFNSIAELGTVFPWLDYDPALLDAPLRRAVGLCASEFGRVLPEYLTGEPSWGQWRRLLRTLSSLIILGLRGGFDVPKWTDQLMQAWEGLADDTPVTPPLAILHDSITFLACSQQEQKEFEQEEFEQLVEGIGDFADDLFIRLDSSAWLEAWRRSRLPTE